MVLKLAHFRRHKRKTLKKMSGKFTTLPFHKLEEHHPQGKDTTKKILKLIGKETEHAGSTKLKIVRFSTISTYSF